MSDGAAARTSARLLSPIPSRRHCSETPTTTMSAGSTARSRPSSDGSASTGSVSTPISRCTASDASASSLLESRRPRRGSAFVPTSRSGQRSADASHAGQLQRGPVVLPTTERDVHAVSVAESRRRTHEHGEIGRRVLEQRGEVLRKGAPVSGSSMSNEIDVVCGDEPDQHRRPDSSSRTPLSGKVRSRIAPSEGPPRRPPRPRGRPCGR